MKYPIKVENIIKEMNCKTWNNSQIEFIKIAIRGINKFYQEGKKEALKAHKISHPISEADVSLVAEEVLNMTNYDFKEKQNLREAFCDILELAVDAYKQGVKDVNELVAKEVSHVG